MILKALGFKYKAQIAEAKANIQVYIDNPVGIGEHPDIVAAVDEQITKLAEAEDKLESLERIIKND